MEIIILVVFIFFNNILCSYYDEELEFSAEVLRSSKTLDFNNTFFSPLFNNQINANRVPKGAYPWAARVVLSRHTDIPVMCNAVCIQPRIFITASRCIVGLSTYYTNVIYNGRHLPSLAHVVPSQPTKQAYDDIGFIVTRNIDSVKWHVVPLFDTVNRTDNNFQWFARLGLTSRVMKHKIVSYANSARKTNLYTTQTNETEFALFEIPVIVGIKLCHNIYTLNNNSHGFFVPCCLQCSLREFEQVSLKCRKYIGVEGAAIVSEEDGKLLGVATWGSFYSTQLLPVGFSVPNSASFWAQYECAIKIRNDVKGKNGENKFGYYRSLCTSRS